MFIAAPGFVYGDSLVVSDNFESFFRRLRIYFDELVLRKFFKVHFFYIEFQLLRKIPI